MAQLWRPDGRGHYRQTNSDDGISLRQGCVAGIDTCKTFKIKLFLLNIAVLEVQVALLKTEVVVAFWVKVCGNCCGRSAAVRQFLFFRDIPLIVRSRILAIRIHDFNYSPSYLDLLNTDRSVPRVPAAISTGRDDQLSTKQAGGKAHACRAFAGQGQDIPILIGRIESEWVGDPDGVVLAMKQSQDGSGRVDLHRQGLQIPDSNESARQNVLELYPETLLFPHAGQADRGDFLDHARKKRLGGELQIIVESRVERGHFR
ncbi:hypothetical protein FB45DRAFT_877367 [Roridomyces roridus]|uniref:Uncharacterized protein n=1 Tax=Roridomyces roridus TaxID=1738132 RepID=A0AAD7B2I9_9AGAR|nr:hypothetical protein FB45DRAFT_877367 [Roridomyces roridus]